MEKIRDSSLPECLREGKEPDWTSADTKQGRTSVDKKQDRNLAETKQGRTSVDTKKDRTSAETKHDQTSEEAKKKQRSDTLVRIILFMVLITHTLLIQLTIRIKKIKNINHKLKEENIIFISEIMKFLISTVFYLNENKFDLKLVREYMSDIIKEKRVYVLSLIVPSVLYYFQNIFFYISMSNIPTPLFQLLYQFRILIVVIFTFIILKRKIKKTQLISIIFLLFSLICLKDYNMNYNSPSVDITDVMENRDIHIGNVKMMNNNNTSLYNMKGKSLTSTLFVFSRLSKKINKRNVLSNILNNINCVHILQNSERNHYYYYYGTIIDYCSIRNITDNVEASKVRTPTWDNYLHRIQENNVIEKNKHDDNSTNFVILKNNSWNNNIIIGVLTTLLATLTSGFSSVFLEYLYINYRFSIWFQNMCLAFFTIILSLCTNNLNISAIFKNISKKENHEIEFVQHEQRDHQKCSVQQKWKQKHLDPQPLLYKVNFFFFFSKYFNSFNEFLYILLLVILNTFGGIITPIFIKHVGSFSRFFVTPISLLFNIYISSIYFRDFDFTFNYFISLVFVSFALYFYFKGRL
ncbi:hypothetical protein, conserved [Plasmodium gonderi]|uniref:UDP-N-acetyl glucosamine:UMP antiporter n=1 Tax=Plasmodium gonderi TaxID=77519 RepID=A0A1Y1JL28_PLAGO|nr:hypothetical protein, conserved [Plasmodium gonderi]GAW81502.1 hypothetical protein, conserved [Plasmodium gonderi]